MGEGDVIPSKSISHNVKLKSRDQTKQYCSVLTPEGVYLAGKATGEIVTKSETMCFVVGRHREKRASRDPPLERSRSRSSKTNT